MVEIKDRDVSLEEAIENINKISENMKKVMKAIIPHITKLLDSFTEWYKALPPEIKEEILEAQKEREHASKGEKGEE